MAATYVNAARPGRLAAKEDATSSSDTWNSWESCTYAGVTIAHISSATLVMKTLSLRQRTKLVSNGDSEGRVQEEAVEVGRAEVLERGLHGRLDLGGDVRLGVVWERLGGVLSADGGVSGRLKRVNDDLATRVEGYFVWMKRSSRLKPCSS